MKPAARKILPNTGEDVSVDNRTEFEKRKEGSRRSCDFPICFFTSITTALFKLSGVVHLFESQILTKPVRSGDDIAILSSRYAPTTPRGDRLIRPSQVAREGRNRRPDMLEVFHSINSMQFALCIVNAYARASFAMG